MKKTLLTVVAFLVLILVGFLRIYHEVTPNIPNPNLRTISVIIGATTITAEVADTDFSREQGLSDRTSLADGRGMLFVFDQEGMPGFWMKDMHFGLDMIWANTSGTIVSITSDATAASYNAANPGASQVFYPAAPAKYVLEVPAGFAAANHIVEGDTMHIGQ